MSSKQKITKKMILDIQNFICTRFDLPEELISFSDEIDLPSIREYILMCYIDGMDTEKIIEVVSEDINSLDNIKAVREEFLKEKYREKETNSITKNDPDSNISKDGKTTNDEVENNGQGSFVLDEALLEEYNLSDVNTNRLNEYLNNIYDETKAKDVEDESKKELNNSNKEFENNVAEDLKSLRKQEKKRAPTNKSNDKNVVDTYIDAVIKNNKLKKEVKEYLRDLFNKGEYISVIEKLAIEEATLADITSLYKVLQEKGETKIKMKWYSKLFN